MIQYSSTCHEGPPATRGRWPLVAGGPSWQVAPRGRWPLVAGGPSWQVAPRGRWSLVAGGPSWQVAPRGRWPLVAGGPSWQVAPRGRWPLVAGGPSWQVAPRGRERKFMTSSQKRTAHILQPKSNIQAQHSIIILMLTYTFNVTLKLLTV